VHLQWIDQAAMDLDNVASDLGPAHLSRTAQLREAADRLADLATLGMAFCGACGAILAAHGADPRGWTAAKDAHVREYPERRARD
jgi:hypothetical protein